MSLEPENTFERLFHECLALSQNERGDFIKKHVQDRALAEKLLQRVGASPTPAPEVKRGNKPFPSIPCYRVLERIGSGGFGDVYLARELSDLRRQVAIKVLKQGSVDANAIDRFRREQRLLANLHHRGLCTPYFAGKTKDGLYFVVMELVRGGRSILAYCKEHALSQEARLELFLRLCETVEEVHDAGIIHRDIKPANILVKHPKHGPGDPYLLDFGIARVMRSLHPGSTITRTVGSPGTQGYMSPEQMWGDPRDLDERADVYSLGVILGRMLEDCGEVPADLLSVVRAATAFHREERPRRVEEFRGLLYSTAHLSTNTPVAPQAPRRHRRTRLVLAAALLTLGAAAILPMLQYQAPSRADLNGDGRIDDQDMSLLMGNFGSSTDVGQACGDINGDGHVNMLDVRALMDAASAAG